MESMDRFLHTAQQLCTDYDWPIYFKAWFYLTYLFACDQEVVHEFITDEKEKTQIQELLEFMSYEVAKVCLDHNLTNLFTSEQLDAYIHETWDNVLNRGPKVEERVSWFDETIVYDNSCDVAVINVLRTHFDLPEVGIDAYDSIYLFDRAFEIIEGYEQCLT